MPKDLISIILPVYNAQEYLDSCFECIIHQTYELLEIIVINDGSIDKSLEISRKYEMMDKRITVIDKINEGLSVAREMGISLSSGTYFMTVDSDDLVELDFVERLYELIDKYQADIALCASYHFDDRNEEIVYLSNDIPEYCEIKTEDLENNYANIARKYQMSDSWNKIYKRTFVDKSNVHFSLPRQYNGTDLLYNYQLLLHEPKLAIINLPLYRYRLTQNSRVRRKNKHLELGFSLILEKLLGENEKVGYSHKIETQIYVAYISMMKYASFDLFNEVIELSTKHQLVSFGAYLDSVPKLNLKQKILIIHTVSSNLRIFAFFLLYRNALGILLYYKVRLILGK